MLNFGLIFHLREVFVALPFFSHFQLFDHRHFIFIYFSDLMII